jgi:hypothetical protein
MFTRLRFAIPVLCLACCGCAFVPQIRRQPQYHNPFPQLHRVAILPFYNLSSNPTVNQDEVAEAYYVELQQIPGFEVMPPGVVKQILMLQDIDINSATDFQQLAQMLGVDVLIRGAVTEFDPYYPPRMGIAVDWFAANPSFHPIPPGYGLPWGTKDEEHIPDSLVREAEFALAREQLKTQTPEKPRAPEAAQVAAQEPVEPEALPDDGASATLVDDSADALQSLAVPVGPELPEGWPDPRGFIPPPPSPLKPPYRPQSEPIISHTRLYAGDDDTFTENLDNYYYFRDDARFGGWQSYLRRSGDFIRFCCHLHIAETLTARGGAGKTRVVWRWPFGRYDVGTGRR